MSPQLVEKLFRKYPKLFQCRPWVDCGDGWYWILDHACRTIQQHVESSDAPQPRFSQIKEKWAKLRIYCDGYTDYVEGVLGLAEILSSYTCENCGKQGDDQSTDVGLTTRGYAVTVCKACKAQARSSGWKSFKALGRAQAEIHARPKRRKSSRK